MNNLKPEAENTSKDVIDRSLQEPYSVFTRWEKWCIVALVSLAAWFSTLSSFIYCPELSEYLAVSVDEINLTIKAYMTVAIVAPTLVGDFADIFGRQPAYLVTLSVCIAANVTIALTRSFHALLGLRILQALGISGDRSDHSFKFGGSSLTRTRKFFYRVWRDYRYCYRRIDTTGIQYRI